MVSFPAFSKLEEQHFYFFIFIFLLQNGEKVVKIPPQK